MNQSLVWKLMIDHKINMTCIGLQNKLSSDWLTLQQKRLDSARRRDTDDWAKICW